MNDPAPPAVLDSAKATDIFFTESIVGRPLTLPLGHRTVLVSPAGVQVSREGTGLVPYWRDELENNAWRYATPLNRPVQRKRGRLTLFLERNALRIAFLALLVMVAAPLAYLAAAWQAGMLDGTLKLLLQWGGL